MSQSRTQSAPPTDPQALTDHLKACQTVSELYRLASSDAFKSAVYALSPMDQDALRQVYRDCQTNLDGKIKLEEFDDQTLRVVDVNYWHTDRFVDESKGQTGDGVTITFYPENAATRTSSRRKALTSSAPVVRFFSQLKDRPTPESPIRVHVKLEPVADAERAAKGQRRWTIRRLPMPTQTASSPF